MLRVVCESAPLRDLVIKVDHLFEYAGFCWWDRSRWILISVQRDPPKFTVFRTIFIRCAVNRHGSQGDANSQIRDCADIDLIEVDFDIASTAKNLKIRLFGNVKIAVSVDAVYFSRLNA